MANWITISTYEYSQQAHIVKNYLESEGVIVFMKDDMTTSVASYYAHAIGGIKLMVKEQDFDRALDILVEGGYLKNKEALKNIEVEILKKDPAMSRETCPYCNSVNIEKVKHPDPIQNALYLILGVIFPILRRPNKCNDCKKMWKYKG